MSEAIPMSEPAPASQSSAQDFGLSGLTPGKVLKFQGIDGEHQFRVAMQLKAGPAGSLQKENETGVDFCQLLGTVPFMSSTQDFCCVLLPGIITTEHGTLLFLLTNEEGSPETMLVDCEGYSVE